MGTEANKDIVRRYLEQVWNEGEIAGSAVYLATGYRRHTGPGAEPLDTEGQRLRLQAFRTAFPDVRLAIEEMVAEGDFVAFRFTMTGTHRGAFQDIPATGRRITVPGLDLVRLRDGLLTEHWGGADLHSLRSQLARPTPAPPAPS